MTEAQKKRYAVKVYKWLAELLPCEITITTSWRYDSKNAASCSAQPEYYRATVNLNIEGLHTEEAIAEHVIHEMLHIPLWPLYETALDLTTTKPERKLVKRLNEQATTTLERMFVKLWNERD